jgi:heptosyltransferase-2
VRILVLRGGALGDFLVTLPALGLLRTRWPDARLELVGNVRAAELAVGGGLLEAVHDQHSARWAPLFTDAPLPAELALHLCSFDLVFNCWPDSDGGLAEHFARLGFTAGGPKFYLSATPLPQFAPAARHFCEPLRALGLATDDYCSRLPPAGGAGWNPPDPVPAKPTLPTDAGILQSSAPIAIHPGSGSPGKNWSVARWRELIARLPRPVLLIFGEAELATWSGSMAGRYGRDPYAGARAAAGGGSALDFAVQLPLPELAARLARCRIFLGHDSGISHLAAAAGAPCVLLFGPTDPALWAPSGPKVRVIRRGVTMEAIAVADVMAALVEPLADLNQNLRTPG